MGVVKNRMFVGGRNTEKSVKCVVAQTVSFSCDAYTQQPFGDHTLRTVLNHRYVTTTKRKRNYVIQMTTQKANNNLPLRSNVAFANCGSACSRCMYATCDWCGMRMRMGACSPFTSELLLLPARNDRLRTPVAILQEAENNENSECTPTMLQSLKRTMIDYRRWHSRKCFRGTRLPANQCSRQTHCETAFVRREAET